jgi:hypothetical protein
MTKCTKNRILEMKRDRIWNVLVMPQNPFILRRKLCSIVFLDGFQSSRIWYNPFDGVRFIIFNLRCRRARSPRRRLTGTRFKHCRSKESESEKERKIFRGDLGKSGDSKRVTKSKDGVSPMQKREGFIGMDEWELKRNR